MIGIAKIPTQIPTQQYGTQSNTAKSNTQNLMLQKARQPLVYLLFIAYNVLPVNSYL